MCSWWKKTAIGSTASEYKVLWVICWSCLATLDWKSLRMSWFQQENERTKDMIIEQRFHRAIIGQKGEKIKEIRDKFPEVNVLRCIEYFFQCHISVSYNKDYFYFIFFPPCFQVIINFPDPAQKSDIVQLRGPRTEVEKCTKFMQKMVAEMVHFFFFFS